MKIASGYVDSGFEFDKSWITSNGQEIQIQSAIQQSFLEDELPRIVVHPIPVEASEHVLINGTTLSANGWVEVRCMRKEDSHSVTLPARCWTMKCLVIDGDTSMPDIIIGEPAILNWNMFKGGELPRLRWSFLMTKVRPKYKPVPSM
jgi:hypothetical protein